MRDIETATGTTVVWGHDDYSEPTMSDADARRIVAAVNAVAGISTEALEAGALGRAREAATLALVSVEDHAARQSASTNSLVSLALTALRALGRTE